MVTENFKNQYRALYDKLAAVKDPDGELDRLHNFVGNRDHEAMAQAAQQLQQENAALKAGQLKQKGWRRLTPTFFKVATVGLGVIAAGQYFRGPDVIIGDGPSLTEEIPSSLSDRGMLDQLYGTAAQYTAPMIVVAQNGAMVHPEIPSSDPASTITKGSCVYAFPERKPSGDVRKDDRQYAQITMRVDGKTFKGYIDAALLQQTQIEGDDKPCKATFKPAP
jgi:hypothetical protein